MTQATHKIETYVLRYDKKNNSPWIILNYKKDDKWHHISWNPPSEDVVYIADLLRNEKPVYWVPEGEFITTTGEPVGEQEG